MMTFKKLLHSLGAQEDLNFLLTNRIPRLALTCIVHAKRLVAYIEALIVLSPYWRPSTPASQRLQMNTSTAPWPPSASFWM